MSDTPKFEAWGLLELFGHQRLAGKLTEQVIGGCNFVRVDVPEVGAVKAYTRLFTQGAIYSVTFLEEELARRYAAALRAQPIARYELPPEVARRLPFADRDEEDEPG